MKSSAKKIELASVDDLFSTEEGRQDAKLEKIQEIPLSELHPFKNHPFKVKDDEAMMETADSIKQYGVLVPAIARPDPEGGYELVAGHRRHRASELADKETMPVIVRDLDDDAATIIMVDSNLQRESLLPSERAFAYKMKLDAMKHERSLLAEKLWYLYHDFSEEAREAGYLSCLSEIKGNGFPEETRRLTEQLSDPAFRQTLKEEYAAFWTAYQQDRDLLRFHYHRPREIWENLKDLDLPRRTFSSDLSQVPTVQHFITEDEIDAAMTGGSSFAGGKGRIYAFFMDAEEKRLAMLYFRWDEVAPLLRGMYARQQDGFGQEQPQPATESPTFHSETMAVYPGDKNNLPYDVVVERLHIEEPEPPAPVTEPEKTFEEVLDEHPVSIQVNGQWQTFPNAKAAEEASYEEYKANLRRNAKNFRITDEHLGEGGPKAKFQANVNAIRLLKELEAAGQQASPEQQEVLSRYVGWGGLSDAFDPEKPVWALEYAQLKELLTPEEYAAARSSTLNAHYTSPTVIRAIYEAVDRMGFETGNILEPSCGVGNFFGMLPEEMRNSRLYNHG